MGRSLDRYWLGSHLVAAVAVLAACDTVEIPTEPLTLKGEAQRTEADEFPVGAAGSCNSVLCALEQCGPQDSVWPDCLAGCGVTPAAREMAVYCLLDSPLCDQLVSACAPVGGEACQPQDFACEGNDLVGCNPLDGTEARIDCAEGCSRWGDEFTGTCIDTDAESLGLHQATGRILTCACHT